MKATDHYTLLWQLKGQYIKRIRRIMYVIRSEILKENGPIEITTAGGSVLLMDAASDGEALSVQSSAWIDPFSAALSAENREFIDRSGKWTSFDVSDHDPYSQLIYQIVDEVTAIRTPDNKITGAIIRAGNRAMRVEVEADEISVDIA